MPKTVEGDSYTKKYNENQLSRAILAIKNGLPKKTAAKKYGIPRATLQFRLSTKFTKHTHGPEPFLTKDEEDTLEKWILESYRKGFPLREEDVQVSVKGFLDDQPRKTPFKDNRPGDGWYKGYLKRHPLLTERQPEGVTAASATVSEADIKKWFKTITEYLNDENYSDVLQYPSRIFNSDETCFMLCPKTKSVLAPKGVRNVYEVDNATAKQNVTVLFTFSADGSTAPPFIIYPYKRIPALISSSVPDEWGIGGSQNGWMKAELFFEYIANVFHPYLVQRNTIFPVILFGDGHTTHTNFHLSELCSRLK